MVWLCALGCQQNNNIPSICLSCGSVQKCKHGSVLGTPEIGDASLCLVRSIAVTTSSCFGESVKTSPLGVNVIP